MADQKQSAGAVAETERPAGGKTEGHDGSGDSASARAGGAEGRRFTQTEVDVAVQRAVREQAEKAEHAMSQRLSEERRRQEDLRLAEQGEYRKLAERREAELEALRAENQARELETATLSMLGRRGVPKLQGLFEFDFATAEGRESMIDFVDGMIEEEAQRRVDARLQTPAPPTGPERGEAAGGRRSRMTAREKAAFIAERGLEAYKKLPA